MKLIQVFALVLALVGSSFMGSCADENKPQQTAESVAALDTLIQALQKAEADIAQGFLLRNATAKNKAELKENIYNLKVAAYRLKKNPDDQGGLTQLYLAFASYDQIKLLKDDETLLGELKQTLRLTLDSLSQRQGVELEGIDRSLFTKSFDTELDPFAVYTVKGSTDSSWKQTGYKEKHYAQAGPVTKDGLESWLLSPKLNLTNTRSPTLVIDQAIRGDNFSSVVTVRVSADNVTGDPTKATWETLKIKKLPDGGSFTFVTSEKIDLKRFEGKTIVVALVYNTGNEIKSSIQWEVGTVTLMGSGQLVQEALTLTSNPVRPPVVVTPPVVVPPVVVEPGTPDPSGMISVLNADFTSGLGTFTRSFSESSFSPLFLTENFGKDPFKGFRFSSYVTVDGLKGNKAAEAFVESPDLNVANLGQLSLRLTEGLWFFAISGTETVVTSLEPQVQVELAVVSDDPAQKLIWTSLIAEGRAWLPLPAGSSLKETKLSFSLAPDTKKIRLRFHYNSSGVKNDPIWVVQKLKVLGI